MERVEVPMEPVEPRMASFFTNLIFADWRFPEDDVQKVRFGIGFRGGSTKLTLRDVVRWIRLRR